MLRLQAALIVAITLFVAVALSPAAAVSAANHAPPKTANFYLRWTVSDEEARALAKWDLVILDMEAQINSPNSIALMRQLHPDIVILAYVTAAEIRSDASSLPAIASLRRELFAAIPEQWFVVGADGARRSFWSGTWIVNVSDRAPVVNGERWNDFLPRFVHDRILGSGMWDGVLYDNAWENISYFAGGAVDLDRDGQAESAALADASWRTGLRALYRRTRVFAPDKLVLENDGPLYAGEVQGLQFENFPAAGWSAAVGGIVRAGGALNPPRIVVVNANTGNSGDRNDFFKFRYGLGSALLFDAYSGFDYGDQNHGQTWWYDEYDAAIGAPGLAPTRLDGPSSGWRAGVWRRDYSRGMVVVNSGASGKRVALGGDLERLHGTQDPTTNDGSIVREIELPPGDGTLLLKPLGEVRGTPVTNGSFVRVFDAAGSVKRTGFFVQADRFAPTATLLTRVTGGKNREVIVADGARVRVYDERNRRMADFAPFGDNFGGGIALAVGDVDGDGQAELLLSGATRGGGLVKIFSLDGARKREFRAFGEAYTGGVSLAVGDTDGDGRAEIVVGAGPGGGPHVRIFNGDGSLADSGFFVFAPKFRGGVSLAVGDTDGDGRAEIVVGAGPGGGPHLRIFDRHGGLRSEFFAYERTRTDGLTVGLADVDGDGRLEILAMNKAF